MPIMSTLISPSASLNNTKPQSPRSNFDTIQDEIFQCSNQFKIDPKIVKSNQKSIYSDDISSGLKEWPLSTSKSPIKSNNSKLSKSSEIHYVPKVKNSTSNKQNLKSKSRKSNSKSMFITTTKKTNITPAKQPKI